MFRIVITFTQSPQPKHQSAGRPKYPRGHRERPPAARVHLNRFNSKMRASPRLSQRSSLGKYVP